MTMVGRPALAMVITLSFVKISPLEFPSWAIAKPQAAVYNRTAKQKYLVFMIRISLRALCASANPRKKKSRLTTIGEIAILRR
jgi:hypothetical protein